jgi:hypothetical protein
MTGCTPKQKQALLIAMSAAFKQYADTFGDRVRVGALTDTPEQNRALILRCGQEFVSILNGKIEGLSELPQLQADLVALLERGCPALDIIDLMFACTRGRNSGVSDTLEAIGLSDPSLDVLRQLCHLVSAKISALNTPKVPGPLFLLPQLLPELSEEDRVRLTDDLKRLPELLAVFGDLLTIYPPKEADTPVREVIEQHWDLAWFYVLLRNFDFGYPTLSVLIRAMRRVRYNADHQARYVRRLGRVLVRNNAAPLSKGPAVRDPFRATALQKRLHRFFSKSSVTRFLFYFYVLQYLSPFFAEQRTKSATLRAALPILRNFSKATG